MSNNEGRSIGAGCAYTFCFFGLLELWWELDCVSCGRRLLLLPAEVEGGRSLLSLSQKISLFFLFEVESFEGLRLSCESAFSIGTLIPLRKRGIFQQVNNLNVGEGCGGAILEPGTEVVESGEFHHHVGTDFTRTGGANISS